MTDLATPEYCTVTRLNEDHPIIYNVTPQASNNTPWVVSSPDFTEGVEFETPTVGFACIQFTIDPNTPDYTQWKFSKSPLALLITETSREDLIVVDVGDRAFNLFIGNPQLLNKTLKKIEFLLSATMTNADETTSTYWSADPTIRVRGY